MKVVITIDGREIAVEAGRDLLTTALEQGVEIPHFCWHGALGSVGACRLCAVKLYEGPDDRTGRIEMACTQPVAEGQRVEVWDADAERFRARVIEWLMVNHPHDCAVCEEGGACHLQDMTIATGHHRRRHRFEKRTHRNQDLGPLLTHEMNRCIACYRCTRFYRHYAGGRDLDVFGAHDRVYFGRAEDGPLESPFAGNLAEICPTGVFNDKGWSQAYARKWDMGATPSVCAQCSVGCNLFLSERGGRLRRVQNRYHGELNGYFLCDRGRFGPLFVESSARLRTPLIGGVRAEASEALAAAKAAIAEGAIGVGSPRASLEANFALRRLVGPENFFAGVSDAEARAVRRMAEILRGGPARIASVKDVETADAALVLGEDLTGTAPRLALALRQASKGAADALAAEKGVPAWLANAARVAGEGRKSPIAIVTPLPDALDDVATHALRRAPHKVADFGFEVAAALEGRRAQKAAGEVAEALAAAAAPLVVAGLGLGEPDALEAAAAIAAALGPEARIALIPSEANSLGLAMLGAEGLESAVVALEGDAARTAIVLDADPALRAAPETVARLEAARIVALDHLATPLAERAAVALPVASFAEAAGTWINFEGRAQRAFAAIPNGPDAAWRVLSALAPEPFGWETLDALLDALAAEIPALAAARDAAPSADFHTAEGGVARGPRRLSGRTADDRAGRVPEAAPPADPDSPLGWTMEGAHGADAPPALRTGYETPGLHSASAAHRFMAMVGGPLRGGDPGLRLIAPGETPVAPAKPGPAPGGEGLRVLPLHDPFAASETDRASPLLAARAPAPRLALHPEDADALGLADGAAVTLDGAPCPVPLTRDAAIPRGCLGLSVGPHTPRTGPRLVRVEPAP